MINNTHFIRTFKGEELLIQTNSAILNHEMQTILRLCDGKFAYDFLKHNVKRISDFDTIVRGFIDSHLITALTDESLKNFHLNRALLGFENIERRSSNRTLANIQNNSDHADSQKTNFSKALLFLSNALSQLNSDQLSSWLVRAEACTNNTEFNLLLDNFRAIYSRLTSQDQASEAIRSAIQLI